LVPLDATHRFIRELWIGWRPTDTTAIGTNGSRAVFSRSAGIGDRRWSKQMSTIERPHPKGLLHSPAFSQVVIASGARTIYTSGQVSIDERGALVGAGDLAAQTAQAMRNLGLALAAAGARYGDIVKTTTYVANYKPEHRAVIDQAKKPFFEGEPPASALVGVSALARSEWLVEIEAVAVTD
jgi:enamine deaminase RidA (YjgF/YER057c/UK114 family)